MRIRDFEGCVRMTIPKFSFSFIIHRAFHSVASCPESQAKTPTQVITEKQLSSVGQLRQAFRILTVAARITAVFGLHQRLTFSDLNFSLHDYFLFEFRVVSTDALSRWCCPVCPSHMIRPFSTYRMDTTRFCNRLCLLPHIPLSVNAEQIWMQLLPKDKRLSGAHALGHADFFSAICDWFAE